jgi:hypothetical protein
VDGDAGSFRVHLDSLKDFSDRVRGEGEAVRVAADALAARPPQLPLGAFAEAFALSDSHNDTAARMVEALGKVRPALEFAERVTSHVAASYEALSLAGAAGMEALGPPAATPVPAGVAAAPPGSLITPDVLARFTIPVPPTGGSVYYSGGSGTVPVQVTVETRDG